MESITPRPEFNSPDDFVNHVSECLSSGQDPCPPSTVQELLAALEDFPLFARQWLPSSDECKRLGIDPDIGASVEPLSEREQERWLVTLRDDEEFRLAMRSLITEGRPA